MRTWVCAIIINREISICKYFSLIITIPQEDMCAVLVEIIIIFFFWHKLSEPIIICNNNNNNNNNCKVDYTKCVNVENYCSLKTL